MTQREPVDPPIEVAVVVEDATPLEPLPQPPQVIEERKTDQPAPEEEKSISKDVEGVNRFSNPKTGVSYSLDSLVRDATQTAGMNDHSRVLKVSSAGTPYFMKEYSFRDTSGMEELMRGKLPELIEREVQVLSSNEFMGTPRLVDSFQRRDNGTARWYTVYDWIEGRNLREIVESNNGRGQLGGPFRFGSHDVLTLGLSLAETLEDVHAKNVVHRDVKPSNVMLTTKAVEKIRLHALDDENLEEDEVSLIDFGFLQEVASRGVKGGSTIVGTKGFMAPEQSIGKATPQSDIYGLGATLAYVMNGGEVQIDNDLKPQFESMKTILQNKRDDLGLELVKICEKAMEPAPSNRYQEMMLMKSDLQGLCAGMMIEPYVPSPKEIWGQMRFDAGLRAEGMYKVVADMLEGTWDTLVAPYILPTTIREQRERKGKLFQEDRSGFYKAGKIVGGGLTVAEAALLYKFFTEVPAFLLYASLAVPSLTNFISAAYESSRKKVVHQKQRKLIKAAKKE